MVDLQNLNLLDEQFQTPVNLEELPEQFGGFELPQPARYVFTLPIKLDGAWPNGLWETVASGDGQRVRANFRFSKDTKFDGRLTMADGKKLAVSLSNIPMGARPSKLDYLLQALGYADVLSNNKAYIVALAGEAGSRFRADLVLTASSKNTGLRYSSRPYKNAKTGKEVFPIPRESDGKYPTSFEVDGEVLRVFPDLESFSAA